MIIISSPRSEPVFNWNIGYGETATQFDDGPLMQPVGFIWLQKPRYRVKAISRKEGEQVISGPS